MSIISSKSNKEKEGFTPYQSEQELNESLLSKLNLNDHISPGQSPNFSLISFDKYSCDLRSIASKKRKLSEECININASKMGRNTFLNRSIVGKSSIDNSFMNQLEFADSHQGGVGAVKKELSENSCPILTNNDQREQFFFGAGEAELEKPRFTKTKNLLRNLSNYMHKFLLYNKRAQKWLRDHFERQIKKKNHRKESQSISQSNKSSDLSCFQDMCRIDDTIKMEETPKIVASTIQGPLPIRDDSDNILMNSKSLSLEERSFLMKDEKLEQMNEEQPHQREIKQQIRQFQHWVNELSISNFSDYEQVWTRPHKYRGLYRICCFKYYRSEAICDIYRSRLTTKQISASYLHQFIEGILQPKQFYRFK